MTARSGSRPRPARIIIRGRLAAALADTQAIGQVIALTVGAPGYEAAATTFRVRAVNARRSAAGDAWTVEIEET